MTKQSSTTKGDIKRAAILDAARSCFAANGLQATSMQDILGAAQLSAGALYRYFPSKEAILEAVVKSSLAELKTAFDGAAVNRAESLEQALAGLLRALEELDQTRGTLSLALQVWAETQRNAALAAYGRAEIQPLIRRFEHLVRVLQKQGKLPGGPPGSIALALMGMLQGFVVQRALLGINAQRYGAGLAIILRSF